jgi:hypothetical protein
VARLAVVEFCARVLHAKDAELVLDIITLVKHFRHFSK